MATCTPLVWQAPDLHSCGERVIALKKKTRLRLKLKRQQWALRLLEASVQGLWSNCCRRHGRSAERRQLGLQRPSPGKLLLEAERTAARAIAGPGKGAQVKANLTKMPQ